MAITINSQPDLIAPAYNNMVFSVESSNVGNANFKFICDIYNDAYPTVFIRKKLPANPSNGYCYFDIAGIVRNYMTSDPPTDDLVQFIDCTKSYANYTVKFGEEYGATSGIVEYPDLETVSQITFIAAIDYVDFTQQLITVDDFNMGLNANSRFLTNIPDNIQVRLQDYFWLSFINNDSDIVDVLIRQYDSAGGLLQSDHTADTLGLTATIQQVGCGAANIVNSIGMDAATSYYTVVLSDSGHAISEVRTFNLIEYCSPISETYTLTFLNKLGGYDSMNFFGQPLKTSTATKSNFKKRQGSWHSTAYIYSQTDRNKVQYQTMIQDSVKLMTGWITDEQATWLEELFSSPDVLVTYGDYSLIPVNITDSNFTWKTTSRDKLFSLEFMMDFSTMRIRQQF